MPDVFLSYSHEDQPTARQFAEGLQREGFTVWWDQTLRSGDPYDRLTETALREAGVVVVLWSKASVQSRWVRAEATIADRNGTLLPVAIQPCERPVMFELTQTAELAHWKGAASDADWLAFVDDVRRKIGRDPAPQQRVSPADTARRSPLPGVALATALLVLLAGAAWLRFNGSRAPVASAPDARLSIAVLPFTDLTGTGSYAPLAEGLAEEISNWLGHIPDLLVKDYQSSSFFSSEDADPRPAGRRLGATYVLKGSVRRGGELLRITVQLVTTAAGDVQWSRTYNLPEADALRVEDMISRSVAESLDARLSAETERRWKARLASDAQAQGLYLQGRSEFRRRTPESNLRALELYRRAIEADPQFPLVYVSLAEATIHSVLLNGRDLGAVAIEAGNLLDRALALSPDMPEAIAVQGWLATEQYRTEEALRLMRRALELNPNDADTQRRMGNLQALLVRPDLAIERYDLAAQLDPLDFLTQVRRCLSLQDLAQPAAAESACAQARELDASHWWGPLATAWLAYGRGDLAAALGWANRALELAPDDTELHGERIAALLALRRYDAAREAVARIPGSAGPAREMWEAALAAEQGDATAVRRLTDALALRSDLTVAQWLEVASLQLFAGEVESAWNSLERARALPAWQQSELVDPEQFRHGYSGAVTVAAVELARGDRVAAQRTLAPLEDALDRMERAGGACSGLHLLRAESRALLGDLDQAMIELQEAYRQGWRLSRQARADPALKHLEQRADYRALLARVDREVLSIAVDPQALSR